MLRMKWKVVQAKVSDRGAAIVRIDRRSPQDKPRVTEVAETHPRLQGILRNLCR